MATLMTPGERVSRDAVVDPADAALLVVLEEHAERARAPSVRTAAAMRARLDGRRSALLVSRNMEAGSFLLVWTGRRWNARFGRSAPVSAGCVRQGTCRKSAFGGFGRPCSDLSGS